MERILPRCFALVAALLLTGSYSALHAAEKPNIILVMPDDVGYGDFSCNGNPIIRTPHIDAFAKTSVRFTDFHVSPTCAPTRCALMTGRHEFKSGVTHTIYERERMSRKAATLPQMLKRAGYVTGIFGKWHLGDEPEYQPNKRGFDEVFIHGAGGIGQTYMGSCGDAPGNTYFSPAILHNGTFEKTNGYCTDVFFNQAIDWIDKQRSSGKPFFAYITPNAAHGPLQVPNSYFARHQGKIGDDLAKFYGMIENIDDNFGRLMQQLDKWQLAENTLVIFMTDNGGTLGVKTENGGRRGGKNTPYQGGTRVPAFWRLPAGFETNVATDSLTAHVDIFPTLAVAAGEGLSAGEQEQIDGRTLLRRTGQDPEAVVKLQNADGPLGRYFVTHCGRWPRGAAEQAKYTNCSIRNNHYSLVNNVELYDLKNDPGEMRNLIDSQPQIADVLRAEYDRWWADVLPRLENENATGPDINPFKALYWKQFGGGPSAELLNKMKFDPSKQR
ncbi:MAG: arylsulfatase [Planctomycetaceae bacterium]